MTRVRKADPFNVWGRPPPSLSKLTKQQRDSLRRYIDRTVRKVYRLAYDLGVAAGKDNERSDWLEKL